MASIGDAPAVPATKDDLPHMGVNGAPVLTVDGRICRFPWTGPDGVRHSTCASLQASGDDSRLWCKDINDLWAICAAPKVAAAKHGSHQGGAHQGVKPDDDGTTADGDAAMVLSTSPSPGARLCLCAMPCARLGRAAWLESRVVDDSQLHHLGTHPSLCLWHITAPALAASADAALPVAVIPDGSTGAKPARAGVAAALPGGLPLMGFITPAAAPHPSVATAPMSALSVPGGTDPVSLVDTSTPVTPVDTSDPPTDSASAPAPSDVSAGVTSAAPLDPLATTALTMPPLRSDVKGPVAPTQAAFDAAARLRVQLATATALSAASPGNTVAAANVRVLTAEIAALLSGYLDPSSVASTAASASAAPVCAAPNAQCGGLHPGSNTDTWRGPSECCGNGTMTCVQTDPAFAQCVPLEQSRSLGCSALYARCGGDFWAGPFCCSTNQACTYESRAVSRCLACSAMYAQCGGMENGKPWSKPSCCPAGGYCKQLNQYYSQCVKTGS